MRTAVSRVLTKRFLLGQFDPLALQPYTTLGLEMINSTEHQALNFDAALQSMVLLHNDGVLPLAPGRRVAVVGPHSISQRDLIEDYAGDQRVSRDDALLRAVFYFTLGADCSASTGRTRAFPRSVRCSRDTTLAVPPPLPR